MSGRSENARRASLDDLRRDFMRNTTFATEGVGSFVDADVLVNAAGVKSSYLGYRYGMFERPTFAEIARDLGMNDEHLRLIMLGKREPSSAFLEAAGFERVVLYRWKGRP